MVASVEATNTRYALQMPKQHARFIICTRKRAALSAKRQRKQLQLRVRASAVRPPTGPSDASTMPV